MEEVEEHSCAVDENSGVYLDDAMFFKHIQDDGEEMNDATQIKFARGGTKVAVARKIHFCGKFYPLLYMLVFKLFDKMQDIDLNLVKSDAYSAQQQLFILSQMEVIHACHLHYGKASESKKITLDWHLPGDGCIQG
jgi:hypothetical protein